VAAAWPCRPEKAVPDPRQARQCDRSVRFGRFEAAAFGLHDDGNYRPVAAQRNAHRAFAFNKHGRRRSDSVAGNAYQWNHPEWYARDRLVTAARPEVD